MDVIQCYSPTSESNEWLPCRASDVIESGLGLAGQVSLCKGQAWELAADPRISVGKKNVRPKNSNSPLKLECNGFTPS